MGSGHEFNICATCFGFFVNLFPGNGKAFKDILCHGIQTVKTGTDRTLDWYYFTKFIVKFKVCNNYVIIKHKSYKKPLHIRTNFPCSY